MTIDESIPCTLSNSGLSLPWLFDCGVRDIGLSAERV